ncbi:MAG: phosphate ABC transporter permease PstA [Pyrinomonadaceae bacterium]|nr:phosphate ABC transporter permease PstA [Phycisphaerales bacterium]
MNDVLSRAKPRKGRRFKDRMFLVVCIAATSLCVFLLGTLLYTIFRDGWDRLSLTFLDSYPSGKPAKAGIKSALWGSIWLVSVAAIAAIPLGVATAIAMEEYKPRRTLSRRLHTFVQINIGNLAGVPSIVYGVIGLTVFARMFGLFGPANLTMCDPMLNLKLKSGEIVFASLISETDEELELISPTAGKLLIHPDDVARRRTVYVREHFFELRDGRELQGLYDEIIPEQITLNAQGGELVSFSPAEVVSHSTRNVIQFGDPDSFWYVQLPFGPSILAGGLTLALVILPIIVIASREALRGVPDSLREGALALGSTRWQVIQRIVLPASIPGIMTGAILAISRAIGEAAPLLMAGAFMLVLKTPHNLLDSFAAMPVLIFNWAGKPQEEFHKAAAAGILVLLVMLLCFNGLAIVIRQVFQKPLQ